MKIVGLGLALASALLVWRHFLAWHEATPFARPGLAALVAAGVLVVLGALGLAEKQRPDAESW